MRSTSTSSTIHLPLIVNNFQHIHVLLQPKYIIRTTIQHHQASKFSHSTTRGSVSLSSTTSSSSTCSPALAPFLTPPYHILCNLQQHFDTARFQIQRQHKHNLVIRNHCSASSPNTAFIGTSDPGRHVKKARFQKMATVLVQGPNVAHLLAELACGTLPLADLLTSMRPGYFGEKSD